MMTQTIDSNSGNLVGMGKHLKELILIQNISLETPFYLHHIFKTPNRQIWAIWLKCKFNVVLFNKFKVFSV